MILLPLIGAIAQAEQAAYRLPDYWIARMAAQHYCAVTVRIPAQSA
jgi:hypothetical protein